MRTAVKMIEVVKGEWRRKGSDLFGSDGVVTYWFSASLGTKLAASGPGPRVRDSAGWECEWKSIGRQYLGGVGGRR